MSASETTQSMNSGIFESRKTLMSQTWGWEQKVNIWISATTITLAFNANFFSNSPYVGPWCKMGSPIHIYRLGGEWIESSSDRQHLGGVGG